MQGTTSLCEQKTWIQNKTIREIILFGSHYDEAHYISTVKACQLAHDLKELPAGDLTEIGDKGINLSGGQKARISLARAVYANADLLLMDDPISALDCNVRKRIFKQVFTKLCKENTIILVTHAVDFLHLSDKIAIMKEGKIVAYGSFDNLQDNEHLQEILKVHNDQREDTLKTACKPAKQEENASQEVDFVPHILTKEQEGQLIEKEEEIEEKPAYMNTFYRLLGYIGGKRAFIVPVIMIGLGKTLDFNKGITI